jgi:hypothetical protein
LIFATRTRREIAGISNAHRSSQTADAPNKFVRSAAWLVLPACGRAIFTSRRSKRSENCYEFITGKITPKMTLSIWRGKKSENGKGMRLLWGVFDGDYRLFNAHSGDCYCGVEYPCLLLGDFQTLSLVNIIKSGHCGISAG